MHWYDRQGTPTYEVPNKTSGGVRPTTLRDAKTLRLVPSVTTVLAIAAKPSLDNWKQRQLLQAVAKIKKRNSEGNEQWFARILKEADKTREEAARRGSELHDKIERFYKEGFLDHDKEFVLPVLKSIQTISKTENWISEQAFAHKTGFGGKVDLYSPEGIIIDFKTKNSNDFSKQLAYDDHAVQLAAYATGLKSFLQNPNQTYRCYNIFISTQIPGLIQIKEWDPNELARAHNMFHLLLNYWKHVNNYDSSWDDDHENIECKK